MRRRATLALSRLAQKINDGEFVVTAEIGPPRGADHLHLIEKIELVKDYCDAINITDNVRGIPTMSSIVCSHFVLQSGAEPIMQMSARDRNRISMESELYGAYGLGIRNVLFVTGDHSLLGSHPQAKTVYDLDSIQMLQLTSHLMKGTDLAGESLEGTPEFFLGSTFNPYADPIELHAMRVEKKIEAGAEFFQTQVISDVDRFAQFMELVDHLDTKILAGIVPIKGPKTAEFMTRRVPGIKIPAEVIQRLRNAGEGLSGADKRQEVRKEGLLIAEETIKKVKGIKGVDGLHLMGIGWEESVPYLVERCGLRK